MQRNGTNISAIAAIAIIVGAVLFMFTGGSGTDTTPPTTSVTPVSFIQLASGMQSTETKSVNYLVTSKAELTELWKIIDNGDDLVPPTVDFDRYDVVAVFAGRTPTAGYTISVSEVEDGASRAVTVLVERPGASCLPAESVTSPYQVIQLPKTNLPMTHSDVEKVLSCLR